MEYLIGSVISIIILFLAIMFYRRSNLRANLQTLSVENKRLKEENEQQGITLHRLLKEQQEAELDIKKAQEKREVAQQRAAEAQVATEQLLQSEQGRLAAELQRRKELGEIEFEQEKEKREQWLNLYFEKLRVQEENAYKLKKEELQAEIVLLQSKLNDFKTRQDSVNEAILRQKELKEKEDFYSIQVSENDKEDIKVLQSMDLKLHNRDVIPKLVWELYIRRPCQEMIKRVTGGRKIGGIYKITNKETGEAYIGKTSSDFGARWTNHVKTTLGLDGCARATLHNRMAQDGLWNYTFEIIEEVDKDHQAEREAFYIDLYGTKQQLNMKDGSNK